MSRKREPVVMRMDDPLIERFTPHAQVRSIIAGRTTDSQHRSRLPDQDSGCGILILSTESESSDRPAHRTDVPKK